MAAAVSGDRQRLATTDNKQQMTIMNSRKDKKIVSVG